MKHITGSVISLGLSIFCFPAFASDNQANDYLLSLSAKGQAEMLGKVAGEGCQGQTAFYKGVGTTGISKNEAFWDVKCTNGKSYEIEVHPDGSSSVLECSVLAAVHAGQCFKKF